MENSENIEIILRQTDYTQEVAIEKLNQHNNDYVKVIKEYLGIVEKKPEKIKSTNQAIYKELRINLNNIMNDYNIRKEES